MGKLRKEVIDDIRRLGEEGYSQVEIADSLSVDRGTVRKYMVGVDSPLVLEDKLSVSNGLMKRLYDLQGILGASSIADAVERAYRDEVSAVKFKVSAWEEYASDGGEFSVEGLIEQLLKHIKDVEDELNATSRITREMIANLKDLVQRRYDEGYEEGQSDHAIYIPCAYCRRPYQVKPLSEAHGVITRMMIENGWGHSVCADRSERR